MALPQAKKQKMVLGRPVQQFCFVYLSRFFVPSGNASEFAGQRMSIYDEKTGHPSYKYPDFLIDGAFFSYFNRREKS